MRIGEMLRPCRSAHLSRLRLNRRLALPPLQLHRPMRARSLPVPRAMMRVRRRRKLTS